MSCHEDQISTNAKTDTTSVDMIRLTKYGFRRSFIRTAAFLSWLGIVSSVLGILGGVSVVVVGISGIKDPGSRSLLDEYPRRYIAYSILMAIGSFIILSSFIFVLMWIHLKRRTSERKISGIEETVKIFNHFIAVLEIIVDTILIIFFIISLASIETTSPGPRGVLWIVISLADTGTAVTLRQVLQLAGGLAAALTALIVSSLRIHGVRRGSNRLVETYIGCRYILCALSILGMLYGVIFVSASLFGPSTIAVILFFILDIGLTVLLHSIRVDREKEQSKCTSSSPL